MSVNGYTSLMSSRAQPVPNQSGESSLKWVAYSADSVLPPMQKQSLEPEIEIRLDKDSDFSEHAQYQPDHALSFPFQCYCGHEFRSQLHYRLHILEGQCVNWQDIKIRGNIIICICGVEFAQRGSLFRHLRTRQCKASWPDGGRALICLCGARFNRRDNMVRHQRSPRCQQNCARLGLIGNPQDSIPPARKNKHRRYAPSDGRYEGSGSGSTDWNTQREAQINQQWVMQFGHTKRKGKASHSDYGEASGGDSPQTGVQPDLSPVEQAAIASAGGESVDPGQGAVHITHSGMLQPVAAVIASIAQDHAHGNRAEEGNTSDASAPSVPEQDAHIAKKRRLSKASSDSSGNSESDVDVLAMTPSRTPPRRASTSSLLQRVESAHSSDTNSVRCKHGEKHSGQLAMAKSLKLSAEKSLKAPVGTPVAVPQPVQPLGGQSSSSKPHEPFKLATSEKMYEDLVKLLKEYPTVHDPQVLATRICDTINKVVGGFENAGKIVKTQGKTLSAAVSTGVAQHLLDGLAATPNVTFVAIVHRVEALLLEQLGEPLAGLIA